MSNLINGFVEQKFADGPELTSWLYHHSFLVSDIALGGAKLDFRITNDNDFRQRVGCAALLVHSGLCRSEEENYLGTSLEIANEVFDEGEVDRTFASEVEDVIVDYWRGLDGYATKRAESKLLVATELYVRFHSNFFVNAYETFQFEDFRDFRGWAKNHFNLAKNVQFPNSLPVSKSFLSDFRRTFDRARSLEQISSQMNSLVTKERKLQRGEKSFIKKLDIIQHVGSKYVLKR